MCSSTPDMTAANTAAAASAQNGKDALDWYKSVYADSAPDRAAAAAREKAVSDAQLGLMGTQTRIADEADAYNRSTFRPLEQSIVNDANTFDTEGKRQELAGLAEGDVHQGYSTARDIAGREMARRGVNVSDGTYGATARASSNAEALATADAATKSRSQSMILGRAMKMDAASLGRGLPSQQATAASLAMGAGTSAAQTGAMPLTQAQQAAAMVGAGYSAAGQGYQTSGNIYGDIGRINAGVDASNSSQTGSAGAAIGTIAVMI